HVPDKRNPGNQCIPHGVFHAESDWRYHSRIYLAAAAQWHPGSFSENTDIFFDLWILGIDYSDVLAAGWLYDDYLYLRNPEYTGGIDRSGKDRRGEFLAGIKTCNPAHAD